MALARVVAQESELGVVYPPWETAPNGVVSLLTMLEFSAKDFVEISHRFGLVLGLVKGNAAGGNQERFSKEFEGAIENAFGDLLKNGSRLGLAVTTEQLLSLLREHHESADPETKAKNLENAKRGVFIVAGKMEMQRGAYHAETLYSTMRAELSSMTFKAIPREKKKFCDPKWLTDGPMFEKFSETVDEFQKAGRCFAYGENTACVFHLLRVADFYFRKVADSLKISYDARNWHGIGKKIAEEMEKKYQAKTDEWKKIEPFYAEILTDLQAIGRGHRNATLHELEKKYEEREAEYMLTVMESFARRVAEKL
jgi:hypothetical protein